MDICYCNADLCVFFAHISATNSRFIIMSMEADLKGFSKIMGQEPRMSHRPVFLWVPACLECVLMSALYKGA